MEEKLFSVYKLTDPLTRLVRYVGISCNVEERYNAHLNYDPCNVTKREWIEGLKAIDLAPILDIVETGLQFKEAKERELYWIRHYLEQGMPLVNISGVTKPWTGGVRGRRPKPEPLTLETEDKLLLAKEVAILLNLSYDQTVMKLKAEEIPAYKVGGWLVRESDVKAYLKKRMYQKPEER
jgi:excisionase family DNA binding protein